MAITTQQLNSALRANSYSDLTDDIKQLIPEDFEQYISQQLSLDDIDPNIVRIIETGETSTLFIDLECSLIGLVHMSTATVGVTLGASILLMLILAALVYYFRQKSAAKNHQLLLDNLKLAYLKAQSASDQHASTNSPLDLSLLKNAAETAQPKISTQAQAIFIAKKTAVVAAANIGTILVLGWGFPAILAAFGVSAGIASCATPAGAAVIGVIALGLTGYAMYRMYRRYQATQKYQATLDNLTQSKLTLFQHSDTTTAGPEGSINHPQLAKQ